MLTFFFPWACLGRRYVHPFFTIFFSFLVLYVCLRDRCITELIWFHSIMHIYAKQCTIRQYVNTVRQDTEQGNTVLRNDSKISKTSYRFHYIYC